MAISEAFGFYSMAPYETAEAFDQICTEYNRVVGNGEVEPLLAIPIFIHDFVHSPLTMVMVA